MVGAKDPLGLIAEFAKVSNGLGNQPHLFEGSAAAERCRMGTSLPVPQSVATKRTEGGCVGPQRLGECRATFDIEPQTYALRERRLVAAHASKC